MGEPQYVLSSLSLSLSSLHLSVDFLHCSYLESQMCVSYIYIYTYVASYEVYVAV